MQSLHSHPRCHPTPRHDETYLLRTVRRVSCRVMSRYARYSALLIVHQKEVLDCLVSSAEPGPGSPGPANRRRHRKFVLKRTPYLSFSDTRILSSPLCPISRFCVPRRSSLLCGFTQIPTSPQSKWMCVPAVGVESGRLFCENLSCTNVDAPDHVLQSL